MADGVSEVQRVFDAVADEYEAYNYEVGIKPLIEKAMGDVIESVKHGGQIATPLRNTPIFPPMVAQMIAIGEETGNLDTMLSKVADFYEDEVAAVIKALTSILEPVMIVIVGGIVGFIIIAMYMPMFQVYDQIK